MAELIKETITTESSPEENVSVVNNTSGDKVHAVVATPIKIAATQSQTMEYLIYFFFGALEILLAFRLILKLIGASTLSSFVALVYGLSGILVLPFEGMFRKFFTQGVETTSVLEPATLVALIVYALIAWGIVKLIRIFSGEQQTSE